MLVDVGFGAVQVGEDVGLVQFGRVDGGVDVDGGQERGLLGAGLLLGRGGQRDGPPAVGVGGRGVPAAGHHARPGRANVSG
ncbi:hypothetical protein GCM10009527_014310 [Actinomadura nitritigenes]